MVFGEGSASCTFCGSFFGVPPQAIEFEGGNTFEVVAEKAEPVPAGIDLPRAELPHHEFRIPTDPAPTYTVATHVEGQHCPKCHRDSGDDWRFCAYCGEELHDPRYSAEPAPVEIGLSEARRRFSWDVPVEHYIDEPRGWHRDVPHDINAGHKLRKDGALCVVVPDPPAPAWTPRVKMVVQPRIAPDSQRLILAWQSGGTGREREWKLQGHDWMEESILVRNFEPVDN